jgi:hypothetical protein
MERRQFIAASLATSALAAARATEAQSPAVHPREYYQIRRYQLQAGPQTALAEKYFADALIPALTRRGMGPIGAFRLEFGQETPVSYLFIPGPSVEALATIDLELAHDAQFLKAAEAFWASPAAEPAFIRVEYSLLSAFEGWPKVTPPASKTKRIFQLRTYESPSHRDHVRKVEMFHSGEFDIFKASGFHPVFFADTLVGLRMPSLTYMLSFANSAELETQWDAFRTNADWKKLSADSRFAYEAIVSNITNLILSPMAASQI